MPSLKKVNLMYSYKYILYDMSASILPFTLNKSSLWSPVRSVRADPMHQHCLSFSVCLQARFVRDNVTVPLETLLGLFQNPLHLIQKRKDKLLDYDRLQHTLDHAEDSEKIAQLREEVLLAKRNYEALNAQLLEELPHFMDAVVTMLQHQLTVLVQAEYTFCSSVAALIPPLLPPSSPQASTPAEIEQQHAEELVVVCRELAKLSLVPASLSYMRTSTLHKKQDSNSPKLTVSTSSAEQTEEGEEEGEGVLEGVLEEEGASSAFEEVPLEGARLQIMYEFVGEDPAELSVRVGESVVLVCAHDRIGCKEWWLVQAQDSRQGYVPASYCKMTAS